MEDQYFKSKLRKIKRQLLVGPLFGLALGLYLLSVFSDHPALAAAGLLLPFTGGVFRGGLRDYKNYQAFAKKMAKAFPQGLNFTDLFSQSSFISSYLEIFVYKHHLLLLGSRTIFLEDLNEISYIRLSYENTGLVSGIDLIIKTRTNQFITWEIPHSRDFSLDNSGRLRITPDMKCFFHYLDLHHPLIVKKM